MLIIFLLLIVVIIALALKKEDSFKTPLINSKSNKDERVSRIYGEKEELEVARKLEKIANKYNGYLFNELIFEDDNGYSCEIDHILITKGGIFVIETKGNVGQIFGEYEDEIWNVRKKSYQKDKILKNPIKQNAVHINHLRRMFTSRAPSMNSIIIFTRADISNLNIDCVFDLKSAIDYLEEMSSDGGYNQEFVERAKNAILGIKIKYEISKKRHIENIKKHEKKNNFHN